MPKLYIAASSMGRKVRVRGAVTHFMPGGRVEHMIHHVQHATLPLDILAIMFVVGTNNVARGDPPPVVVDLFRALVEAVKQRLGEIPIIISQILPRLQDHETSGTNIKTINTLLRSQAPSWGAVAIPSWQPFLRQGRPRAELFQLFYPSGRQDGVHLCGIGYDILNQKFRQELSKVLGADWNRGLPFTKNTQLRKPFP